MSPKGAKGEREAVCHHSDRKKENTNPGILCLFSRLLCSVQHTLRDQPRASPVLNGASRSCPAHFLLSAPTALAPLLFLWSSITSPSHMQPCSPAPVPSQHVNPAPGLWPTRCPPTPTALRESPPDRAHRSPLCKKNLIVRQTVSPFCPYFSRDL